jgi:CheY-like chemotaxis protein/GGDEF domain-containing protein
MVKVLLLEDDSNYREIIERVIRRSYSYAVTSVATERQAWEELSRESFDLVLLDLNIDGKRCWETLKRAVGHPGKPVAIVFSCEDTVGNAEYAVSHGAYTFLSKPFNFTRLKTTLDTALFAKHRAAPGKTGIPEGGGEPPTASPGWGGARSGDCETAGRPGAAYSPGLGAPKKELVAGREREDRFPLLTVRLPKSFRARLREEFERTLRYQRNLTLVILALDGAEKPGQPRRAPNGVPAVAIVQRAVRIAFRRTDLVAQCGMNEFSMLMPETRSDRVLARISGLRDKLQRDLASGGEEMPGIAVWIGMATLPTVSFAKSRILHVRCPEDFLRMARLALYQARLNETPVAIFDA